MYSNSSCSAQKQTDLFSPPQKNMFDYKMLQVWQVAGEKGVICLYPLMIMVRLYGFFLKYRLHARVECAPNAALMQHLRSLFTRFVSVN